MKVALAGLALLTIAGPVAAQQQAFTPKDLESALHSKPRGQAARDLAERIRAWFGADLAKGVNPKVAGVNVAWAVEAAGVAHPPTLKVDPSITNLVGFTLNIKRRDPYYVELTRVGDTDVYAYAETFAEGEAFAWSLTSNGMELKKGTLELYSVPFENLPNPNVKHGKVTKMPPWKSSIFEGTTRDWWIYVPAQYDGDPAAVMVFQDGGGPSQYMPAVLDNLIARAEIPVTVGIFISPGTFEGGRSNRSVEYDTLSDRYARFLLEEILPEVEKTVKLTHDPEMRAIAGISSGGICAWTVAWERPNEFRKVLSWVGSFTDIASGATRREGGHNYPALIRKTQKKPIRIYMQDGENDLNNEHGNWPLANLSMANSLGFMGYDYKLVWGRGFHSDRHGRALLPESLRWLLRKQ